MKKPDSFLCLAKPGSTYAAFSIVCDGKQEFYELDIPQLLKLVETGTNCIRVLLEGNAGNGT